MLVVNHRTREVTKHLFRHYINLLTLLLPTHGYESLIGSSLIIGPHTLRLGLQDLLLLAVHLVEDSQEFHMLCTDSRKQWIVVGCVLV